MASDGKLSAEPASGAKGQAIRAALDAIPSSPANMAAETCIEVELRRNGFHVVHGAGLGVQRRNEDKPRRCPACHAVTVDLEEPSPWRVYQCCRCAVRFTRFPRLARFLPFAGVRCSEHAGEAGRG